MRSEQLKWTEKNGWDKKPSLGDLANFVVVFGNKSLMSKPELMNQIKKMYPSAIRMGCSTAGEIHGTEVVDGMLSVSGIYFEHTRVKAEIVDIQGGEDCSILGTKLRRALAAEDLAHLFVLSDGIVINGSQLVSGITRDLPAHVAVTGGLAADGTDFKETLIYFDDLVSAKKVVAVGFYGKHLRVGYGSMGGWDPYGAVRKITRSENNVLYELDGQPALDLYKKYLGDKASELPSSALLFPLNLKRMNEKDFVVRTILGVDEKTQSMTFAGDVPMGSDAQFMKANFNRLVDAASVAAGATVTPLSGPLNGNAKSEFAILISCVGRKLLLKQRIEEEVEAVRKVLGPQSMMTGFYSYGEISPFAALSKCELHNQTMTITTLSEEPHA